LSGGQSVVSKRQPYQHQWIYRHEVPGSQIGVGAMHPATALFKDAETTETKQVRIFIGRSEGSKDSPIEKMRRKFDTLFGRFIYNKRIAIVEPVFGNLKNKGMDRFTLRGKQKVNTQWQLFSLVHNIEKMAHVGAV